MSTPTAAHTRRFFTEATRDCAVWTINDENGFPAPVGEGGIRVAPFWSSRSRVETIIETVPAYSDFHPVEISLADYEERWLPGLRRDGFNVGVNWSGPRATGYELTPGEVLLGLDRAKGTLRAKQWTPPRVTTTELAEQRAEEQHASAPLLERLAEVGVTVDNVWHLDHPRDYPRCIPVLIDALSQEWGGHTTTGIAAGLKKPEARSYWEEILRAYETCTFDRSRDALADVIGHHLHKDDVEDVRRLIGNEANGRSRLLIAARAKSRLTRRPDKERLKEEFPADTFEGRALREGFSRH